MIIGLLHYFYPQWLVRLIGRDIGIEKTPAVTGTGLN
jgi:hypothetical protein